MLVARSGSDHVERESPLQLSNQQWGTAIHSAWYTPIPVISNTSEGTACAGTLCIHCRDKWVELAVPVRNTSLSHVPLSDMSLGGGSWNTSKAKVFTREAIEFGHTLHALLYVKALLAIKGLTIKGSQWPTRSSDHFLGADTAKFKQTHQPPTAHLRRLKMAHLDYQLRVCIICKIEG